MSGAIKSQFVSLRKACLCVMVLVLPLHAACSISSDEGSAFDDNLVTNSVDIGNGLSADDNTRSDIVTIRNAVSSANLETIGTSDLMWANRETGSRGSISAIEEFTDGATICRRFTALRESYAGVALHKGEACLGDESNWWMKSFDPV